MSIPRRTLSSFKNQPGGIAGLDSDGRVDRPSALSASARLVSPRDFGGNPNNSGDNTAAVQSAIDYCQSSRGAILYIDGYYRCNSTITVIGNLHAIGQDSSGGNSGTDKSVISFEGMTAGNEFGIRVIGQNWSFRNIAFKGGARAKKIMSLEAASVGRLIDCNVRAPHNSDQESPGSCIWGYGLINVEISGCTIIHRQFSRGIDVRESNKPAGSGIYYGFDNGSNIKSCRVYGDMANIIADGGTFEISNCDFQGISLLDTGKVIVPGTSTKLIFSGNYCEYNNAINSQPTKTPVIWLQNQGSGHSFTIFGNTAYNTPSREAGSIALDLGGGSPSAYYALAYVVGNGLNRFESAFSLRGRQNAGYTFLQANSVGETLRTFATKSYYQPGQSRGSGGFYPGVYSPTVSSEVNSHSVLDDSIRTEGQTRADMWMTQTQATIDLSVGNKVSYTGVFGAELTYGGRVSGFTVTNGGSGYTSATVAVSANGIGGKNAVGQATVSGGVVTGIALVCEGENYTSAPSVTIAGDGDGATATAQVDLSVQPCFCGADYRIHNGSGGSVTLKSGNGLAGTFRAGVGISTPITLAAGQTAIVAVMPNRTAVVEGIVG